MGVIGAGMVGVCAASWLQRDGHDVFLVEAGEPGFMRMWEEIGGMERFDRRRRWWADAQASFQAALR